MGCVCCCCNNCRNFPVALGAKCPLNRAGLVPVPPFLSEHLTLSLLIVSGCVAERISARDLVPAESSVWGSLSEAESVLGDGGPSAWPASQDGHEGQGQQFRRRSRTKVVARPGPGPGPWCSPTAGVHAVSENPPAVVVAGGRLDFPCFGSQVFQ